MRILPIALVFILSACRWSDGECADARAEAAAIVEAARVTHLGCTTDEDCVLVSSSTDCESGCPVVVARGGDAAVAEAVASANAGPCDGYASGGCPVAMAECVAMTAVCDGGTCEITF